MSSVIGELDLILTKYATISKIDSMAIAEVLDWFEKAVDEHGVAKDLVGIVAATKQIHKEIVKESRQLPLEFDIRAFEGLSLGEVRKRCIGLLLAAPSANTDSPKGIGAERLFDFMESVGWFAQDVREY